MPELLTVKEVAAITRLSVDTIRRAIRDGELPEVRLRARVLVPADAVTAWIARNTTTVQERRTEPTPRALSAVPVPSPRGPGGSRPSFRDRAKKAA